MRSKIQNSKMTYSNSAGSYRKPYLIEIKKFFGSHNEFRNCMTWVFLFLAFRLSEVKVLILLFVAREIWTRSKFWLRWRFYSRTTRLSGLIKNVSLLLNYINLVKNQTIFRIETIVNYFIHFNRKRDFFKKLI